LHAQPCRTLAPPSEAPCGGPLRLVPPPLRDHADARWAALLPRQPPAVGLAGRAWAVTMKNSAYIIRRTFLRSRGIPGRVTDGNPNRYGKSPAPMREYRRRSWIRRKASQLGLTFEEAERLTPRRPRPWLRGPNAPHRRRDEAGHYLPTNRASGPSTQQRPSVGHVEGVRWRRFPRSTGAG
jgi:hypothetical protein